MSTSEKVDKLINDFEKKLNSDQLSEFKTIVHEVYGEGYDEGQKVGYADGYDKCYDDYGYNW